MLSRTGGYLRSLLISVLCLCDAKRWLVAQKSGQKSPVKPNAHQMSYWAFRYFYFSFGISIYPPPHPHNPNPRGPPMNSNF